MIESENLFKGKYRIPSTRLSWWDYSENGAYFITICTKGREEIFGEIKNGIMGMNELGIVVTKYWREIPNHFGNVILDEWVVMPNHVHGIILVNGPLLESDNGGVEAIHELPLRNMEISDKNEKTNIFDPKCRRKMIIPKIIGRFKMQSSKEINQIMKNVGGSIWQPNYHDRIIRDETELHNKRRYIRNNPRKWSEDKNHPNVHL